MNTTDSEIRSLRLQLHKLRRKSSRFVLMNGWIRALMLILVGGFIISTLEGFRYFGSTVRTNLFQFMIAFAILFLITPPILALLISRNRMSSYSDERLAIRIGTYFPEIADRMLNVLQLLKMTENPQAGYSIELAEHSVKSLTAKTREYDFEAVIPWKKLRISMIQFLSVLVILSLIFLNWSNFYRGSFERLSRPRRIYEIPLPFSIESLRGTFGVFGGDSVGVAFACNGDVPEEIRFQAVFPEYSQDERLAVNDSGIVRIDLGPVRTTVLYEAFVVNRSLFKPWRRISSGVDTVFVTDRPEILNVRTRITAPAYTRLGSTLQESNNPELTVYAGSNLELTVTANKRLENALIHFASGWEIPLIVNGKTAKGQFDAMQTAEFVLKVTDEMGVSNLDPMTYKLRIVPDSYPVCQLISPDADIELTERMEIPLGIRISDDFGFSKAAIRYRILKRYATGEARELTAEFPIADQQLTVQELYRNWSVDELNLAPEDVVEFSIIVYDNDVINGPKSAASRICRARFPSLNDLFSEFYDQQDEVMEEGQELEDFLQNNQAILEEISRELLKDSQVNWEQKNQLSKEIEKTREAGEKLATMAEQLEDMIQKSRDNKLFDEETLDKFARLQEAFQQVMTPELREAMEKLQNALERMDSEEVRKALNQFITSRQEFSRELDRMLQLLERVKIEQSVDEIVRRLEDIVERQDQLNREMEQTGAAEKSRQKQQADTEKAIERDTEISLDIMDRTSAAMQEFPLMPARQLQEKVEKYRDSELLENLDQVQTLLKSGKMSSAQDEAKNVQQKLQEFLQEMQQFQTDFKKDQMDELMRDFRDVITKTMRVSQQQERLSELIQQTPRQSDQLIEHAIEQQAVQQNLAQIIGDIIALSNKTFGLASGVGRGFGQASADMQEAIRQIEERNPKLAAKSANDATTALNQSAMNLINSMNRLQEGGSASGFQSYLEQLQNMAGQQQGINADTRLLGIGEGGQQSAMRRLAARQQQMRKSLEQLQKEISASGDQTGDLGGIANDMEAVIRDLQQNRILKQTLARQQRILTRLLDAQKSLKTQGFKKERKSKSGQDILRESPGELPADFGERQSLLRENLEKALKEGYTKEAENIIRQYFELLSEEAEAEQ